MHFKCLDAQALSALLSCQRWRFCQDLLKYSQDLRSWHRQKPLLSSFYGTSLHKVIHNNQGFGRFARFEALKLWWFSPIFEVTSISGRNKSRAFSYFLVFPCSSFVLEMLLLGPYPGKYRQYDHTVQRSLWACQALETSSSAPTPLGSRFSCFGSLIHYKC